jgi:hypothetical protein
MIIIKTQTKETCQYPLLHYSNIVKMKLIAMIDKAIQIQGVCDESSVTRHERQIPADEQNCVEQQISSDLRSKVAL